MSSSRRIPFERSRSRSPISMSSGVEYSQPKEDFNREDNPPPSPVVHFRNLPADVIREDVFALAECFGAVRNCLLMRLKNQALLEMNDASVATVMVSKYTASPPMMRGKTIYVQFSRHTELKKQGSSSAFDQLGPSVGRMSGFGGDQLAQSSKDSMPNKVLRVIIDNMQYRVDLEAVYQIFSKYGQIDKMIIFKKNEVYSSLVQFRSISEAVAAKQSLHGLNVYTGCCKLRITFSTQYDLEIKEESDKARDFTKPRYSDQFGQGLRRSESSSEGGLSLYDDRERGLLGRGSDRMHRSYGYDDFEQGPPQHPPSRRYNPDYYDRAPSPPYRAAKRGNCVLHVSNLDETVITPEALFTLFGVYGNVLRVKIIFTKKDTALIQMEDEQQAESAKHNLSGATLYGKKMRVSYSKYDTVEMPKEDTAGLTKDFTDSKLNRFFKPGSKNFQNIFPPSQTLHLSNIGVQISDEDMQKLFADKGFAVEAFKFFVKDRRMALIRMSSVDESIKTLVAMHNYELDPEHHLRVSFTKSVIQPDLMPN